MSASCCSPYRSLPHTKSTFRHALSARLSNYAVLTTLAANGSGVLYMRLLTDGTHRFPLLAGDGHAVRPRCRRALTAASDARRAVGDHGKAW